MTTPPYRLTTMPQVQEYVRGRRDSLSRSLVRFARAKRIRPPALLSSLPERIELPVCDIREEYRHDFDRVEELLERDYPFAIFEELKTKYRGFIDQVPVPYDAAIDEMLPIVRDLAPSGGRTRESATGAIVDPDNTPIAALLQRRTTLAGYLTRAFWHYLNTRDPVVEERLRDSIQWLLIIDPVSGNIEPRLEGVLANAMPNHGEELSVFYELHSVKLAHIRRVFLGDMRETYLQRAKSRILGLSIAHNAKTDLLQRLRSAAKTPFNEKTARVLERSVLIHGAAATESDSTILRSVTGNFIEKMRVQAEFDERHFQSETLDALYRAFHPFLHRRTIRRELVANGVTLKLYPCKDYHDYLKGRYSGDCTVNRSIAAGHLLSSRFLNMRIFRDSDWIGNIYLLDYTADQGAVILDRLQLANTSRIMPLQFFPLFVSHVVSVIAKAANGARVLAPQRISNFARIQRSFDEYALGRPRLSIKLQHEDRRFESYGCNTFVVLWPE